LRACTYFGPGGRDVPTNKCDCPFHVDGLHRGKRIRKSLRTRNRQHADKRLADLIRAVDAKLDAPDARTGVQSMAKTAPPDLSEAIKRFLKRGGEIDQSGKFGGDLQQSTWRKYRCGLTFFQSFCAEHRISALVDITLAHLEDYRLTRSLGQVAW